MELKEKLRQILKERYGIENDAEIIKEARALQGIDSKSNIPVLLQALQFGVM